VADAGGEEKFADERPHRGLFYLKPDCDWIECYGRNLSQNIFEIIVGFC